MPEQTRSNLSLRPEEASPLQIRRAVENYYSGKFRTFGDAAQGVDWKSEDHQKTRFEVLLRMLEDQSTEGRSILDYGCGYGALRSVIQERFPKLRYYGFDLSAEMLKFASARYEGDWLSEIPLGASFDYVIASGVFNVRLDFAERSWRRYVQEEVSKLFQLCTRTLAMNFLPSPTEGFERLSHLFYVEPMEFADWCERAVTPDVTVVSGYGIHDVTFMLRRSPGSSPGLGI